MHKELPKFLAKLKERGFMVKLDTNGFFPDILEECLGHVDYVAMDVKTCLEKYKLLGAKDTTGLMRTVEILKTGKVPYEFRTTVVPELVTAQDFTCIGEMVKGSKTHALQQFVPDDTLDKRYQTLSLTRQKPSANSLKPSKPTLKTLCCEYNHGFFIFLFLCLIWRCCSRRLSPPLSVDHFFVCVCFSIVVGRKPLYSSSASGLR